MGQVAPESLPIQRMASLFLRGRLLLPKSPVRRRGFLLSRPPNPGPRDRRQVSPALLFTLWGYDVQVAYRGPGALRLPQTFRPPVALLELELNGLDGRAPARYLREVLGQAVASVALTGFGEAARRPLACLAGFAFDVLKPAGPERHPSPLARLAALSRASRPIVGV